MKKFLTMAALCVSAMFANAQTADVVNTDTLAIDTLSMLQLQEIVVKGVLPNTRLKGDAMVTKIAGSTLAKAGTAQDVLRKVPGIIKKGDNLEVIGRGTPVYYINGRRVRDTDELKRLMSDEIANVEVIANPGAVYDATVSSVVRITTVKRKGDGFGFNFFGKSEQSLRTAWNDPEAQIDVNYRHGGVDFFASAKEWQYRSNQWSELGEETSDIVTGEEIYRYAGNLDYRWRGIGTHLNAGFNWQINEQHSLGAKVDYTVTTTSDTNEALNMTKWNRGVKEESVVSNGNNYSHNPHNVLVNAYYNGNVGKLNIDFNTDMFFSNTNEHQFLNEQATTEQKDVESVNESQSNMIAAKLVLSHPVWKGMLMAGTEETFVWRDNNSWSHNTGLRDSQSEVDDKTYAAFLQYNLALNRDTYFNLGLRYEHASFSYTDALYSADNLNRTYDNLFPSASVSTRFGRVRLSLAYSSKTQRPSFMQLNQPMSYHNRYVVQQGNPKLQPSTEHSVSLTGSYSFLTLGAVYSQYNDLVCNWSEQLNDEGTILVSYRNIDKPQRQVNVFAVATKTWGCYTPSWTVALVKQWLKLDFDNGSRSFNKPMWVFNASNAFSLKHNWQLELNSEFHSTANYSNVELTSNYWSLETAVQKSWLKDNALTVRLSWQDMLRRGNNDVFIYYGSFKVYQTNQQDFNRVILTVRYNFNTARSKYKGTGAGRDAINRIGSSSK